MRFKKGILKSKQLNTVVKKKEVSASRVTRLVTLFTASVVTCTTLCMMSNTTEALMLDEVVAQNMENTVAEMRTATQSIEQPRLYANASADTALTVYSRDDDILQFDWYIPKITLDYEWETFELSYKYQKHLYTECQRFGFTTKEDYFLMLGVIARESRFDPAPENLAGKPYFGFMGCGYDAATDISKWIGLDYTLDVYDPYDNITLGVATHAYLLEQLDNDEYAALWAYGSGLQGYRDAVAGGQTTSSYPKKAYKYRDMLMDDDLNPKVSVRFDVAEF